MRTTRGPGGFGGRILVNAADLRRSSKRLRALAGDLNALGGRLQHSYFPAMPAEVAADARATIDAVFALVNGLGDPLAARASELDVRALWTEIADEVIAGAPLSDAQLQAFIAALQTGALVRYVEPWEAGQIGEYVAARYADTYRNPQQFFELAGILRGSGANEQFAVSFVEGFGAQRMLDIPRVIQAMEYSSYWARSFGAGSGYGGESAFIDFELGRDYYYDSNGEFVLRENPLELLAGFSLVLATATTNGLSRDVEREIAGGEDTWAMAHLLTGPHRFGTEFLVDCFRSGVAERIGEESRELVGIESYPLASYSDLRQAWGPGLSLDPKVHVLEALGRNPDAAAEVFRRDWSGIEIQDRVRDSHSYSSAADILLLGKYDDQGLAMGRAWAAGVDGLIADGDKGRAANLTERLAHEYIAIERGEWDGLRFNDSDDIKQGVEGLSRILSAHYMGDVFESASSIDQGPDWDWDPVPGQADVTGDGLYGMSTETGALRWSRPQLVDLFDVLLGDDEARSTFLTGSGVEQARLIHEGAGTTDLSWAERIGNFNGVLQASNDIDRVEDSEDRAARQAAISKMVDGVMSVVPLKAPWSVIANQAVDLVQGEIVAGGSAQSQLMAEGYDARSHLRAGMDAAIVAGMYEANQLGDERAIAGQLRALARENEAVRGVLDLDGDGRVLEDGRVPFLDERGHVIPYNEMSERAQIAFNHWIDAKGPVYNAIERELEKARQGYDDAK